MGFRAARSSVPIGIANALTENVVVDTRDRVTLTTTAQNGTVTGAGDYAPGSNATLTATAAPGYIFGSWSGDASGTANPLELIMDFDKTVTANFTPDTSDADDDGLSTYLEAVIYRTDPTLRDTDALDLTVTGDEVWVAAGTYYPDDGASVTTGDRAATFSLKQDVKLYGGFVGGETDSALRNAVTNTTILSGEIWTEKLYWSLHVVTLVGDATLDGFTVTKGTANGDVAPYNQGGGIYVPSSKKIIVKNCTLTENTAISGGAIYSSSSSSSITATNCTFSNNSSSGNGSSDGGGAICSFSYSSITATNCTFSGNTATSQGGVIYSTYSPITATNCTFTRNTAKLGGAIYSYSYSSSSITATNCTFTGNTATSQGGVIYSYSAAPYSCSITATNCTFSDNTATSGGTIYSYSNSSASSSITATNCTFSNNSSSGNGSSYGGGAIYSSSYPSSYSSFSITATNCTFTGNTAYYGGVIYSDSYTSSITAINCTVTSNTAKLGGAIYCSQSTSITTTSNCTFLDNVATGIGNKGGAIYSPGRVKIFNDLFWHTLAQPQTNLIYLTNTGSLRNADVDFPSPLNQAINLLKGGMAAIMAETGAVVSLGDTAVKILTADPLFVNAANPVGVDGIWRTADDGLRLQATSPVIDLGLSMFLPVDAYDLDNDGNLTELIPVDLAGYDRIQRAALDLGAYEVGDSFQPIGIVMQPLSIPLLKYLEATFTVTATGYDLRYQWYLGNSGDVSQAITGATGNSITTPELSATSSYWVRVSNALGFVDSQTATATVVPIIITVQPANTVAAIGATATLSVTASGKGLTYQWYQGASGDTSHPMEDANLPGFTTPALAETSVFWVRITNAYGVLDSDAATVTVMADPVAAALNAGSTLLYTAGGNATWFAQSVSTHDGFAAAQSGVITHSQSTSVQTSVAGAGTISFWWNVSSQSGGDYLRFYIDGVEQSGSISGTTGVWAQKSFTVATAGAHTFKWAYTKNSSTSTGSDCGWADDVVWTPKLITTQPVGQSILSGMCADMNVTAAGSNLTYQWYVGESGVTANPVTGGTTATCTTPALVGTTKYWVKVGDGVGFESSASAVVTVVPPDPAIAGALNSGGAVAYFTWGTKPWIVQAGTTHDGVSAMQSGAISHSQISLTEAVVEGGGVLSFWWKVSSELGFDFLRFHIDGVEQGSLSGEAGWQQATFNLPGSGVHKLKWAYVKDDSKTSGSDQAWLDQVAWQAATTATTYQSWVDGHNLKDTNALMTANPAGDGVSNLVKYALGLNPNVPALSPTDGTHVGLPTMERIGGSMKFTFIKDTGISDVNYTVETCVDLGTWQPVTTGVVETPLTGTLVRVDVTIPVNGQRFCRLNVTK